MEENSKDSRSLTLLLNEWKQGDKDAFEKLMEYVYDDLKKRASRYMKHQRPGHSLQTTGLVHEAFIKLVDKNEIEWQDRQHFFAIASKVMRRILIDYARQRTRVKRGGKNENLPFEETKHILPPENSRVDLLILDEALNSLASFDDRLARIVELKYFGGLTLDEIAELLNVSRTTVKRDWNIAKAWLKQHLESE
jgi:RNA polymerase sigma factor (TIGR02999 family)